MNPLEEAIHQKALEIAAKYRGIEGELLEILQRVDEKKVFRTLGYPSLFDYAVKALKLTEATASNFITVARKAGEVPEIKAEILAGTVSVATVRKLTPVIEAGNAAMWLEKAKTLTKPQLEKEVAKVRPEVLTPERAKYVAEKRVALSLGVSEEVFEMLKRIKDLLSQKTQRNASLEDAIEAMAELYLEKHDPVEKARSASLRVAKRVLGHTKEEQAEKQGSPRPKLPAAVRHAVVLRDNGQCTFQMCHGGRCGERRWLDFHHTIHRSQGGGDTAENLTLLCAAHHQIMHGSR